MKVRIVKSFVSADSPRPVQSGELLDVTAARGKAMCEAGLAVPLGNIFEAPERKVRARRERAVVGATE